jgi:ATP-dependent helicase HrpB
VTADRAALRRIERVAQQLERQLSLQRRPSARWAPARRATAADSHVPATADDEPARAFDESAATGLLLAFAYPDRIGRSREGGTGRYVLANGRGAALPGPAALARSEYIVVAALDAGEREARIHLAAPVELALLLEHFGHLVHEETSVAWDARSEAVSARRVSCLGELVLREEPVRDAGAAALAAMVEGIRSMGLQCLPWTRELEQWRARVAFSRQHDPHGDAGWPDVSDAALLAAATDWLGPWLEGVTRRDHLARVDLRAALHALLDHAARRRLDAIAPAQLTVPSGSRIAIDYSSGMPTLAVRLQEVFGLARSPTVAEGRVPVTLELLSPARRPVQVTRDLESFWTRGYHEVRRELKGRYPKHYWPEDPREATPTHRVRPPGA